MELAVKGASAPFALGFCAGSLRQRGRRGVIDYANMKLFAIVYFPMFP